ncbi:MAG TPA: phosphate-starvation-inducible PsiE family protein [Usitatibacter sp.]|nr:phosphate-starvation-inducible PsiE family protein [Usitatibacter sp.]
MAHERLTVTHKRLNSQANVVGSFLVDAFHYLALFAIGGTIVWSAVHSFVDMVGNGRATIDDILLLFIYLELGAMVGIYFTTNHMPVRFLIYVSITALTRLLILDIQHNHTPNPGILLVSGGILLLAVAALVIRYASYRFPSRPSDKEAARVGSESSLETE